MFAQQRKIAFNFSNRIETEMSSIFMCDCFFMFKFMNVNNFEKQSQIYASINFVKIRTIKF